MINKFRGSLGCAVLCAVFLFSSLSTTTAQVETTSEGDTTKIELPKSIPLDSSSIPSTPSPVIEIHSKLESDPSPQRAETDFSIPEKQGLSELAGKEEVRVLADVNRQFVQSITENQIIDDEVFVLTDSANLSESIRAGRKFNRDALAAAARTEQAKAQTGQALALLLPSLSLRVNRGIETSAPSVVPDANGELISPDSHWRTDAALTVRQPLLDLPGILEWRRRKVIENSRQESYRVSDGDAYLSTINSYLSLVSSRLQADMTLDFEKQLQDLLAYIEKRSAAGASSISDMSRVRARSEATLSSRLEQESAHAAAGIEFIRLTNLVPEKIHIPAAEEVGAESVPATFAEAVATAMRANPEIVALTTELEAAKMDKSISRGKFIPRIDAEYTDSYSLHAGGSDKSQRDKRSMIVLNWDLVSGGRDYNSYVEKNERHKELQYKLDDQRRKVMQTLSANYATLATTRERIDSGYKELKSISTAAEAMSKRMLSGNQSLLDLLDVYDRFYQVRSRLVSLHILEMNTVAQLIRLTVGTPWAADTQTPKEQTMTNPQKPTQELQGGMQHGS